LSNTLAYFVAVSLEKKFLKQSSLLCCSISDDEEKSIVFLAAVANVSKLFFYP
jgi:hypothetical protein